MPSVTGVWSTLPQSDFEVVHFNGGFLHFREANLVRAEIEALALIHGWPLTGIFISGSSSTPSFALDRADFPTNPPKKADRLQNDLDDLMQARFNVEGAEDDDGNPIEAQHFHANSHVFNYREDGLYEPVTDYLFIVSNNPPGSGWWQ